MASICELLNLPEILDRRHISLAQNQSSPSVPFQKRTLFERSTTLRDDRCCSHAYMLPRYEHTHFLPQYWSGQNRTSRTACAGPDQCNSLRPIMALHMPPRTSAAKAGQRAGPGIDTLCFLFCLLCYSLILPKSAYYAPEHSYYSQEGTYYS